MILPFLELYYMQCIIEVKWFEFYVDFKLKTLSSLMKSDFSAKHFHLTAVSRDTACFPGYFWYAAKVGDAHQIIWIIDKGTDPLYLWRIWSLNVLLKCCIIYFQVLSLVLLLWNQISILLFVSVLKCCSVRQNKVKWLVTDLVGTECDVNEVVRFFLAFIFMSGLDSAQFLRDWVRVCN